MQSLFSVFHSLGLAIMYNTWQVALLWMFYVICIDKNAGLTSSVKYFIAACIQFLGAGLFISTFAYFLHHPAPVFFINQPNYNLNLINQLIASVNNYIPYLALLYLVALAFLFAKWLLQYFYTLQFYKPAVVCSNPYWNHFIQQYSAQFSFTKNIQILLSQKIQSPVTIGFLKPIILIPLAGLNHLSQEQMEAVLLHEIAHIKRNDYLVNLLTTIIETILCFNPFTFFIGRIIKKERENSCDDFVLSYQYQPQSYAEALLQLAYLSTHSDTNFTMPAAKNDGVLLTRIKRIVGISEHHRKTKSSFSLLLFILIGLLYQVYTWLR